MSFRCGKGEGRPQAFGRLSVWLIAAGAVALFTDVPAPQPKAASKSHCLGCFPGFSREDES